MLARGVFIAAAVALLGYTFIRIPSGAVPESVEPASCPGCNIVLVSIDTLRADHLGAYGYDRPTSPVIDELASRSVVFDSAVSQSAWTRPAHASMLTGLYPAEHGIVGIQDHRGLVPELLTLPAVLGRRGYATAAFTGGANMAAHFGFDNGFEEYRSPGRRLEDTLGAVERFLGERREPFFLFLHGFDAHKPYKSEPVDRRALGLPAERARGMRRACREGNGAADLAPFVADYDAAVHRADRAVGRLLALLERAGVAERTVVVVTSDHGEEFLEHGRCFHIRTLYREIVDVPLIVHVPGVAARRVAGPVAASVAIAPTLAAVVGAGPRARLPGPSLARALVGGARPAEYVVSETSSRVSGEGGCGDVVAITGEKEKLVWWFERGEQEYFDLVADPFERDPVRDHERVAVLEERIERWRAAHPLRVRHPEHRPLPRKLARELRALGYAE